MKTRHLLLITLLILVAASVKAQTKTVELPRASFSNTRTVEIGKVVLTDTATVLNVEAFFRPGYWIKIVSDSYLQADGKKYMIRSGEGIELDSLFWMPESGRASFTLTFDPLPMDTESFNFIESDCEDCFKIWGINLSDPHAALTEIPEEYLQANQSEEDFEIKWSKGDATVSGTIAEYVPGTLHWELTYTNPITGRENKVPVEVDDNGAFSTRITVYSPTNLFLSSRAAYIPIKVAPGKESKIFVNLPEIYRESSRLLQDKRSSGEKYYYAGYLAKLNKDLANKEISFTKLQQDYIDTTLQMSVNEYKDFMMGKYRESISHNNTLDICPLARNIANATETFLLTNKLTYAESEWLQAYAIKNKTSWEEAQKAYVAEKRENDYNDYYRLLPYDEMYLLLLPNISQYVRSISYAREDVGDPYIVIRMLIQHKDVEEADREVFSRYLSQLEKGEKMEDSSATGLLSGKYKSLMEEIAQSQFGEGYLSRMWRTDTALLLDLIKAQKLGTSIQDFNPLTDEQKGKLSAYPKIVKQIILEENEMLLAKIEENKKKTGFTVLNTPTNADEELFVEMLKPFKGKVILVDVWATWCGPCRSANISMEPLKVQLADEEDLVYLYLAGENSPENTWKNMIVDLKGVHYRVNQAQWDYLSESLNARGVPTYIIIDREGNHSFHSVGFPGPDTMKRELMKALEKEI